MEFSEKLQELRKRKGLTQEEAAQALYVSRTAVSKWESGRGYPNIESLKAIAALFAVTVDELLSGDEVLTIAEANQKQAVTHIRDLVYGLLDCGSLMFLFLPFFREQAAGMVRSVSLLLLRGTEPYLKGLYLLAVVGLLISGVMTLALQTCRRTWWVQNKHKLSLVLSAAGLLLFIISLQPYAAAFWFLLLIIKTLMVITWR